MTTIHANILRLPASSNEITIRELSVEDTSASLSSLFPQVLNDTEELHQIDIQVLDCSSLLDNSAAISEVIGHEQLAFLTFILKPSPPSVKQEEPISNNLPSGFMRRVMRNHEMLLEMLRDKKWFGELLEHCPAVGQDRLAFALLQDIPMLECVMKDKKNLQHLLSKHPSLCQAMHFVNKCLLESATEKAKQSHPEDATRETTLEQDFSLDQFNSVDDEDEDEDESEEEPDNQLDDDQAARLMQLLSNPQRAAQPSNSGRVVASSARIDPSALRAALSQAQTQLNPSRTAVPPPPLLEGQTPAQSILASEPMEGVETVAIETPQQRWSSQLQKLAEMGITDTDVALQALEATGGDLQLAISLLFG